MAKPKPFDPLDAARRDPLSVESVTMNPAHFRNTGFDAPPVREFPRELFDCKNLKRLSIFRGITSSARIPSELGQLSSLEELTLGGLAFSSLPDEIGKLSKLVRLDLSYCARLQRLPETIGWLSSLEELELAYTGLVELPQTLGNLSRLKKLRIANVGVVPAELFQLEALEELTLPDSVTELPPGLGRLGALRVLSISAKALCSAASELKALTKLRALWVVGPGTAIPEGVGALGALTELSIAHLGLPSLPARLRDLANLETLSVDGNTLGELSLLVAALPKLTTLSFSNNPLPASEKRLVHALMRLTPAQRPAALQAASRASPAKKKSRPAAPERLGSVASVNASLSLLVADALAAERYQGARNGIDGDSNAAGSDWDRMKDLLDERECAPFDVDGKPALALTLGVGQGVVSVWGVGARLVLVEGIFASDEGDMEPDDRALFLEFVASKPSKARKVGALRLESGALVLMPSTDACPDVGELRRRERPSRAATCGENGSGLLVTAEPGQYAVSLEAPLEQSWGSARRGHLVRMAG